MAMPLAFTPLETIRFVFAPLVTQGLNVPLTNSALPPPQALSIIGNDPVIWVCHFAVVSTTPLSGFLSVSMAGTIHYGKGEGSHVAMYQTRQPRTLEDLGTLPLRIRGSLLHQVQETPGTPVEYQPTILGGARKLTQPKVVLGLELIVLIKARARKGLIPVVLFYPRRVALQAL